MLDVNALYHITGFKGRERLRVEKAMQWLLSPEAGGEAERLLRKAYALHGKSLEITKSDKVGIGYDPTPCRVEINFNILSHTILRDELGNPHSYSIERGLAHEFCHAAQPEVTIEFDHKLEEMQHRIQAAVLPEVFNPAEQQEWMARLDEAKKASDYKTARQHIVAYATEMPRLHKAFDEYSSRDPEYIEYVRNIEEPAIEVENRIAAIRGEPLRHGYIGTTEVDPEFLKTHTIRCWMEKLKITQKPRSPASTRPVENPAGHVAEALQSRGGYKNTTLKC